MRIRPTRVEIRERRTRIGAKYYDIVEFFRHGDREMEHSSQEDWARSRAEAEARVRAGYEGIPVSYA